VLTVAVVTKPFKFEGSRKARIANEGISELLGKVDTLIVIPNEKLREVSPQKITLANAFGIADGVLKQAVACIADLLSSTSYINLDFADLRTILKDAGYAHMGVGEAAGKGKVESAAIAAVESPLMETSIRGAKRILIRVTGSTDITMEDIELVVGSVQGSAHPDANIIFGVDFDEELVDALRVVVIATDFDESGEWKTAAPIIAEVGPKPDFDLFATVHTDHYAGKYTNSRVVDIPLDDYSAPDVTEHSAPEISVHADDGGINKDEWDEIFKLLNK
jgi:cell division protein FtsZ